MNIKTVKAVGNLQIADREFRTEDCFRTCLVQAMPV